MKLNFIVQLFAGAIAEAGQAKLEEVLEDLANSNPADFDATVRAGHAFIEHIKPLVEKSKTNVDDVFVNAIEQSVNNAAANHGITFVD